MEKPKQDQISDFVAFGEPCPYCGSTMIMFLYGDSDDGYKILIRRRSWLFLWWKAHPAYYMVKCNQCKEYRKELLPTPTKKKV